MQGVWFIAAVVLVLAAPFLGPELPGSGGAFVLWQLRVPRVLAGVLVGMTLAVVGAAYQVLFANPLATPSTVGTTAGATLGVLAMLVVARVTDPSLVVVAAFLGAILASAMVAFVSVRGHMNMQDILLAGIAVSMAAAALSTGLRYSADPGETYAAVQWSLGHLAQVGYDRVLSLLPFTAATVGGTLWLARGLATLVRGEDVAFAQGVPVRRLRTLTLVLGALGVAATVAWCGPIAFVGLVVPHLVRRTLGSQPRRLLGGSVILGPAVLVASDTVARLAWPGRELPVGVVTAAIGAPALVWLITRSRSGPSPSS